MENVCFRNRSLIEGSKIYQLAEPQAELDQDRVCIVADGSDKPVVVGEEIIVEPLGVGVGSCGCEKRHGSHQKGGPYRHHALEGPSTIANRGNRGTHVRPASPTRDEGCCKPPWCRDARSILPPRTRFPCASRFPLSSPAT
ncbi:hypothetical protein J6590_060915 [Homalodisca vitripennis]|nr:hypothetical protein J6590_060915 [Homalodisca vitripennis]